VYEFITSHVVRSCDHLVFVLDKILDTELRLIKTFLNIYEHSDHMKNMSIVHNFKHIKKPQELRDIIKQAVEELFKAIPYRNNVFKSDTKVGESKKSVYHYVLGDDDSFKTNNNDIIDELRFSILNGNYNNRKITTIDTMITVMKETLYKYYDYPNDFELIKYIKKNDTIFLHGSKDITTKTRITDTYKLWSRPQIEINQLIKNEMLHVYIECAGLQEKYSDTSNAPCVFKITDSRNIFIRAKRKTYLDTTEEIFEKVNLIAEVVIIRPIIIQCEKLVCMKYPGIIELIFYQNKQYIDV